MINLRSCFFTNEKIDVRFIAVFYKCTVFFFLANNNLYFGGELVCRSLIVKIV